MKHLIIGSGPAGVTAAETLRQHAPNDEIVLLGAEPGPPYARTALPYLLAGEIPESGTYLREAEDHFSSLRIDYKTGRVRRIDSTARRASTEDGRTFEYDRLLIASGASPIMPLINNIHAADVHACWSLHDVRQIMQRVAPRTRVVLIGAGFTGCLIMEALAMRGASISVVERRDRMLPDMMGEGASKMIRKWCETKGIRVRTSTRVTGIQPGSPHVVLLSDGQHLVADVTICATGTRPNIGFLRDSGVRCLQGILVDHGMRTSIPNIYAAGDCAEVVDPVTKRSFIAGVHANAADQGYCAALNMLGKGAMQSDVRQMDVLDTLGLPSSSFGQWRGVSGGQWVEMSDSRNFRYLRLEFSKNVLVGSNAIGLNEHASVLRELIQHRIDLGGWKERLMKDPTCLPEAYRACTQQRQQANA